MNLFSIRTYITRPNGECFYVVTHNRLCSAAASHGQPYAETIAYRTTESGEERLGQDDAAPDSIVGHQRMVERIVRTGSAEE